MTVTDAGTVLLDAARALAPAIRACSDEIERDRRLPQSLVRRMAEAGLFRMLTPRELGGLELDPLTKLRIIEEVARADGAAGWCLMIGAQTALLAAHLPDQGAREIFAADPLVVTGGSLKPGGRAVPAAGGYRVTGRWPFASGSQHCDWLLGVCVVFDPDGSGRPREDGTPETRLAFFPAAELQIIDTWSVGGLRGTGSHDFAIADAFVPEPRSMWMDFDHPLRGGALYRFPFLGLLAAGVAAVPLGIARAAIDALVELAGAKTPTGSRNLLRERGMVQAQVAQAEALLRAARAFLYEVVGEVWDRVAAGDEATPEQRALLRLAATHAAVSAAQAVDLMYSAGGASAIYTSSPLERAFRDVHTATQHALVQPITWETAGRALLGCDPSRLFL